MPIHPPRSERASPTLSAILAKTLYAHLDRQAFAQVARAFGLLCDTVMLTPETP
jgi:hypothetical protein